MSEAKYIPKSKKKPKSQRKEYMVQFRVNREFWRRLQDYSDVTGDDYSKLIRRLLNNYFRSNAYKQKVKPFDDYSYEK